MRRLVVSLLAAIAATVSFGAVVSGQEPAPSASAAPHQGHGAVVVVIYGASWCGPCHQTADWLEQRGVAYVMKDIEETPGARAEMEATLARVGRHGGAIPVIDVRGQILVGFDPSALAQALAKAGIAVKDPAPFSGAAQPGPLKELRKVVAAIGDTIRAGARPERRRRHGSGRRRSSILDGADPNDAALAIERGAARHLRARLRRRRRDPLAAPTSRPPARAPSSATSPAAAPAAWPRTRRGARRRARRGRPPPGRRRSRARPPARRDGGQGPRAAPRRTSASSWRARSASTSSAISSRSPP